LRIHHLNCISSCPLGGFLMDGRSSGLRGRLSCHCLLLELNDRLVLVDTGFGLRDVAQPRSRLSWFFLMLTSPDFREEMTAIRQIQRLGFNATDVRDIVLSHLDFDHAGGLDDFPRARVHLMREEQESALAQSTMLDRMRYRPQQWGTRGNWVPYTQQGERWNGFECVKELQGLPPEILLIPMRGHTLGHAAIAMRQSTGWLLHAADAYFYQHEMDRDNPRCTPGLRFYQWMMEKDRGARLDNQRRLRELKNSRKDITVMCSHDEHDFEVLAGRPAATPAAVMA
jgi:glyoxylase-like metal-dependent hydrolase (beta-lactamase superfamily II)